MGKRIEENRKDNNPITFKEERKQFMNGLTKFNTEIEEIEPIGWKENTEERKSLAGGEYMKHIEEINSMIDRERRANAREIANAQNCVVTKSEER